MDEMMKLALGWTIVGGFVFTTIITCLSLVGWVRFADRAQQKRLFAVLIVEVVVGAGAQVLGGARFDAKTVQDEVKDVGAADAYLDVAGEALNTDGTTRPTINREQMTRLLSRIRVKPGSAQEKQLQTARTAVAKLPAGTIDPAKAREIRLVLPTAPK
jgi:hypothetical protein